MSDDNTEKKLDALIEALGFEVEEFSAMRDGKAIPDSVIYYKVTKKDDIPKANQEDLVFVLSMLDLLYNDNLSELYKCGFKKAHEILLKIINDENT